MRIGANPSLPLLLPAILAFVFLAQPAFSGQDSGKKVASVVAGTVFRDPGFALPGAKVELIEVLPEGAGKKSKPQHAVSDAQGEFAFRLPPKEAKFKVRASAKGYQPQEKETTTSPGVRMDVFFTLQPAAK